MDIAEVRAFLRVRCDSLLKDVRHCIMYEGSTPDEPAPFPALLYCFSTIDLLGALYGGDAVSARGISERSRRYMVDCMGYQELQAELLQKVFRHKLVHLAQLMPQVRHGGQVYSWAYCHEDDRGRHLQVQPAGRPGEFTFCVSILALAIDVERSVFLSGGYLDRLAADAALQRRFEVAFGQIM